MLSDHKNLKYFATTKQLMHCQVHWLEYLSGFNYLIHYCAGWLGTKPDVLTCHEDVYPHGENAYSFAHITSSPCSRLVSYCMQSSLTQQLSSSPSDTVSKPSHSHSLISHAFESALTRPPPSQPRLQQTLGHFHKMATSFATRD